MPNIEVVIIPDECLKNTSFGTKETCEGIYDILVTKYKNVKITYCVSEDDLREVVKRMPDLVVLTNKIMLIEGKEIWLSGYFASHNIKFTGSSEEVLKCDLNKVLSKEKVAAYGVETARFFTAIPGEYKSLDDLPIPFPLFIKPIDSANSHGIDANSFVLSFAGFQSKVKELYETYKSPILVEEYLSGREFTVSIIKSHQQLIIAPIEIIIPLENNLRILSCKVKGDNSEILKRISDDEVRKKVSNIAKISFEALGVQDFGRIDVKMDLHERCCFLEANLTPGMTRNSSYFPTSYKICELLEYDEVISLMVQTASERQ